MACLGENPVPSSWTPVVVPEQWYSRYVWDFIFTWLHRGSGPQYIGHDEFLSSLNHDQRTWLQNNVHDDFVFDKKTACLWFQNPQEAMLFRMTFS